MTFYGGSSGDGTIFAFNTTTDSVTILHSFVGGSLDGAKPSDSLVESGSILYGATVAGGAYGDGTVFSFDTTTDQLSVLHSFDGSDGSAPNGGLYVLNNMLYGTTFSGGSADDGVIFDVNLPEPSFVGLMVGIGAVFLLRRRSRSSVDSFWRPMSAAV